MEDQPCHDWFEQVYSTAEETSTWDLTHGIRIVAFAASHNGDDSVRLDTVTRGSSCRVAIAVCNSTHHSFELEAISKSGNRSATFSKDRCAFIVYPAGKRTPHKPGRCGVTADIHDEVDQREVQLLTNIAIKGVVLDDNVFHRRTLDTSIRLHREQHG